jgi:lipopolysaccharide/colanic/teichoic acid biosynthesis glycosyltransferase
VAVTTLKLPAWKRVEDLILAVPAFVVMLPVFVVVALAIVVESGPPAFFVDERVGVGGRLFRMVKFRTMTRDARTRGLGIQVSVGDSRITRMGTFLRRYSLDELPQLVNVLRGDMSVVGPRPTYSSQVARYSPRHRMRLAVRPGITGLAQVSGRNDLSWSDRIEQDITYIEQLGPWLDLRILIRTPVVVIRGLGLYGRGGVTPDYDPEGR